MRPGTPFACDRHGMRHEPACQHRPRCPGASARDRAAACVVASHPEQGWSLLCNGIVVFEDTGELLPGGGTIAPHRPTDIRERPEAPPDKPAAPAA